MGETIIDSGSTIYSSPVEGSTIQGDVIQGDVIQDEVIDSSSYESAKPAIETDAAVLTVAVPLDATVSVNGHPTTSGGSVRQFKSRGLKEGFVYTYVVKVTYSVDGQEKTESKSVKLRPGADERVEFVAPVSTVSKTVEPEPADVVTVVKLRVPAEAKVTLAGNPTNGSGPVRTFRTKQLKPGQQWAGYTIRVTMVVNGQTLSEERTIDVSAGSTNELAFNFDRSTVASR